MKLLILNIVAWLFLASCSTEYDKKLVEEETHVLQGDVPDQTSRNIEVLFTDSNVTKAILKAGRARIYSNSRETILDSSVYIDFFDRKTGKKDSYLIADSARIDDETQNMVAVGNVFFKSDSQQSSLKTNKLYWNNQTRKFYTDEFVVYDNPREHFEGYGFESDENLTNSTIYKISNSTINKVSGEQK